MTGQLISVITSPDPQQRNLPLDELCAAMSLRDLQDECAALERFRRQSTNLYERVRALFFLYSIHRFHLPLKSGVAQNVLIPFRGYEHLLQRRFEEAIEAFLEVQIQSGPSDAISSALATAYN